MRKSKIDLYRILATYSIILMHIGLDYCNEKITIYNLSYYIGSFYVGLTRWAVPMFLMITGAFAFEAKNKDWKTFYIKSFRKLGIPLLIFSFVYVMYYYARNIFILKNVYSYEGLMGPLRDWFYGIPGKHLWYMYMLIPIYMLIPWMIRVKEELTDKQWCSAAVIMLLLGAISDVSSTYVINWGLESVRYFGYVMMGDVLLHTAQNGGADDNFYMVVG